MSGGIPAQDLHFATFQPTFLYEIIWDLALAAFLVWLGHYATIKPWGLFALYVAGYSASHSFEESVRIDSSEYFLGLRLNMYIAILVTLAGLLWFVVVQRRPDRPVVILPATGNPAQGIAQGSAEPPAPFGRIKRDGTPSHQPERQGPEHRAGNPHEPTLGRPEWVPRPDFAVKVLAIPDGGLYRSLPAGLSVEMRGF